MGFEDVGRLREIVIDVTAAAGYDLEEVTIRSAGRRRVVRVVIDSDGGVTLDAAAEVSRSISERLDAQGAEDPVGNAPYTLEVTSPGVGRPLTTPAHFRRARTRLVSITTGDGRTIEGHVLDAGDTGVRLVQSGRSGVSIVEVAYPEIGRAKVEVEFGPPSADVLELLGARSQTAAEERAPAADGAATDNSSTAAEAARG